MEGYKNINENPKKESFEKEDHFVFLSKEELESLDESERSIYYRKLEQQAEMNQEKHYNKISVMEKDELDELYQGKNDNTEEFNKYNRIKEEQKKQLNSKSKNKKRKFKKDNSLEGIFRRYDQR
jgi:hypothetical protein